VPGARKLCVTLQVLCWSDAVLLYSSLALASDAAQLGNGTEDHAASGAFETCPEVVECIHRVILGEVYRVICHLESRYVIRGADMSSKFEVGPSCLTRRTCEIAS
jgi:hypothetical protein